LDTGQSGFYLLTQLIDQFVEGEIAAAAPAAPRDVASGRLHQESGSAFRTKQGWRGQDHGNLGSFRWPLSIQKQRSWQSKSLFDFWLILTHEEA
jgi:hypothetical protein